MQAWAFNDWEAFGEGILSLLEILILDALQEEGPMRSNEIATTTELYVSPYISTMDEKLVVSEPSGLIRFAGIGIAISLIDQASQG